MKAEKKSEVGRPVQVHRKMGWLGSMRGTLRIAGDIAAPVVSLREWIGTRRIGSSLRRKR